MIKKIQAWALAHKMVSASIAIVVIGGGYWIWSATHNTAAETRYVLGAVTKQTIITSVTGTGQISASNQIDVKPKVSGTLVAVAVNEGQTVKNGEVLAQIDATDAYKAVRDANVNLESAKLSLQKLQEPADALSLTQAQNALSQAQQTKSQDEDNLTKAYDDAFTAIANAFLDLPTATTGLQSTLYGNDYSRDQNNISYYADQVQSYTTSTATYKNSADSSYQTARADYDKNFLDYKSASRYSSQATIESLLNETYTTTKSLAEAIKSSDNYLSFIKDTLTANSATLPTHLATHQANLATYTGLANSNLLALFNSINTISNTKDALTADDRSITEKTQSLQKLQGGTDPLDIKSAQLTVQQRQNALTDAQQNLADYTVRAPFDGTVAKVNFKVANSVGSGDAVATLTTAQQIAEVTLNEVDVAKIKTGDKATLTFSAIDGLSISGTVAEIDTIGTVSQGVVSYTVKISLDTQDNRVKPGMTVNASIITNVKQDVLAVPNAAIKTTGGSSYVQILDQPGPTVPNVQGVTSAIPPRNQPVQTGLSNDTYTEITSGLNEGEQIVVRTITPTTKTTTTQTNSILPGAAGGNRVFSGGGGNFRPGN